MRDGAGSTASHMDRIHPILKRSDVALTFTPKICKMDALRNELVQIKAAL